MPRNLHGIDPRKIYYAGVLPSKFHKCCTSGLETAVCTCPAVDQEGGKLYVTVSNAPDKPDTLHSADLDGDNLTQLAGDLPWTGDLALDAAGRSTASALIARMTRT